MTAHKDEAVYQVTSSLLIILRDINTFPISKTQLISHYMVWKWFPGRDIFVLCCRGMGMVVMSRSKIIVGSLHFLYLTKFIYFD